MSWKKFFKVANASPLSMAGPDYAGTNGVDSKYSHYASHLPEVYSGHPNRIERYGQYENMDVDSEVNAALDILAEFCTQLNTENGTPFTVHYHDDPSDTEVETITKQLTNWCNLNEFNKRVFKMFRNTLKYGDQVFIRDPETFEWYWVDMNNVIKVIVNESEGKKPEQYVMKEINPNFENLTATQKTYKDGQIQPSQRGGYIQPSNLYDTGGPGGGRFDQKFNENAIEAEHVVHHMFCFDSIFIKFLIKTSAAWSACVIQVTGLNVTATLARLYLSVFVCFLCSGQVLKVRIDFLHHILLRLFTFTFIDNDFDHIVHVYPIPLECFWITYKHLISILECIAEHFEHTFVKFV